MTSRPRKLSPGAQPGNPQLRAKRGNLNALKHGFYSRRFTDAEKSDLDAFPIADLASEIALLRIAIRRIFDLSYGIDDLDQAFALLRLLSTAAGRLARLHRVQIILKGDPQDETNQIITQAISEYSQELNPRWKT